MFINTFSTSFAAQQVDKQNSLLCRGRETGCAHRSAQDKLRGGAKDPSLALRIDPSSLSYVQDATTLRINFNLARVLLTERQVMLRIKDYPG